MKKETQKEKDFSNLIKLEVVRIEADKAYREGCYDFIDKYSKYKQDEKVQIIHKETNKWWSNGIVVFTNFDINGMVYTVQPISKDLNSNSIQKDWVKAGAGQIYKLEKQ